MLQRLLSFALIAIFSLTLTMPTFAFERSHPNGTVLGGEVPLEINKWVSVNGGEFVEASENEPLVIPYGQLVEITSRVTVKNVGQVTAHDILFEQQARDLTFEGTIYDEKGVIFDPVEGGLLLSKVPVNITRTFDYKYIVNTDVASDTPGDPEPMEALKVVNYTTNSTGFYDGLDYVTKGEVYNSYFKVSSSMAAIPEPTIARELVMPEAKPSLDVMTFSRNENLHLGVNTSANKASAGDIVEVTINIENQGQDELTSLEVFYDYDFGDLEVMDANGGTVTDETITWNVDFLPGLESVELMAELQVRESASGVAEGDVRVFASEVESINRAPAMIEILGEPTVSEVLTENTDEQAFQLAETGPSTWMFVLTTLFGLLGLKALRARFES